MRYESEARLIPHYDAHLAYSSHFNSGDPSTILSMLGIDMTCVESALDVGCGNGRLAIWLSMSRGIVVDAVDYSAVRIQAAQDLADSLGVRCRFACEDIHGYLDSQTANFDLIALFEVLEHLEDPAAVLAACRELLADGGCIIGSVPLAMPYVAHLQVFADLCDVRARLVPTLAIQARGFAFCKWRSA